MSNSRNKIICFGEVLIDLLAKPPASPDQPRAFLQYAGGAPANVAVAAARLGAECYFSGMLGEDLFGDFLFNSLQEAGVKTDGIVRTNEAKTALAFVALDHTGERSFSFYRPPAADLLFKDHHFSATDFEHAESFHVCSNSLTEKDIAHATLLGMQRARNAGVVVSMDLNYRPMLWDKNNNPLPTIWSALQLADFIKFSREEVEYLIQASGKNQETLLTELFNSHAKLIVITDGSGEMLWFTANDSGCLSGFKVSVVDTTAAGDAFVGGFLYYLGKNYLNTSSPIEAFNVFIQNKNNIEKTIYFGAATGALAVTKQGAFAAMPTLSEVNTLLETK